MLNSIVTVAENTSFPKLMRYIGERKSTDREVVVIFTDYTSGVYVSGAMIGLYTTSLIPELFEPFHGTVTLGDVL